MRIKSPLIALALLVLLCAMPALALLGDNTKTFKGRVNFIQQTNFTILTPDSQLIRILVTPDKRVPSEVQLGVEVEVKAARGNDGLWYLDKFRKIHLAPTSPE